MVMCAAPRVRDRASFFFFNDTATTEIYTLSLHDALPIWQLRKVDELAVAERAGTAAAALEDLQAVDGGLDAGDADGALRGHGQFACGGNGGIGHKRGACKGGGEGRTLPGQIGRAHV